MGLLFNAPDAFTPVRSQIARSPLPAEAKQALQQCAWSGDYALKGFAVKPTVRRSEMAKDLKAALKKGAGRGAAEHVAVWTLIAQAFFATFKDACDLPLSNARLALPITDADFALVLKLAKSLADPDDVAFPDPNEVAARHIADFAGTSLNWMARAATGHTLVDDELACLWGDAASERLPEEFIQLRHSWQRSITQGVERRQERMDAGKL
ncbi:MAG TPA: hypothetical protein VHU17_09910 [Acidimicrobiales bacterium]|jgi:hypothetical protein|nr:hypothetical protein [Acidimicrobiales bacterium]